MYITISILYAAGYPFVRESRGRRNPSENLMKKSKFNIPAAILIFLVLYLLLIGIRPLIMPDEARYVEIPREMLADHDFVTPHLNGLRYFEKPIMGYWLIAGSLRIFGENTFAANTSEITMSSKHPRGLFGKKCVRPTAYV